MKQSQLFAAENKRGTAPVRSGFGDCLERLAVDGQFFSAELPFGFELRKRHRYKFIPVGTACQSLGSEYESRQVECRKRHIFGRERFSPLPGAKIGAVQMQHLRLFYVNTLMACIVPVDSDHLFKDQVQEYILHFNVAQAGNGVQDLLDPAQRYGNGIVLFRPLVFGEQQKCADHSGNPLVHHLFAALTERRLTRD
jgi:hypothetical protein